MVPDCSSAWNCGTAGLQLLKLITQIGTDALRIRDQSFGFDHLEYRYSGRRGDRIAAKGVEIA